MTQHQLSIKDLLSQNFGKFSISLTLATKYRYGTQMYVAT